ncbi:hypothetical protein EQG49_00375 [Periweissella cryptocerci]|uniref:Uncharacterized protein n=1 Tax=Periweissella cryptocerci TaxID=2506420 RepID=A0A4P6YQX0_9LACO|nr:hypothetical protein [Periweissella cryptocerci]QBO35010.1 hypothetical protein EQG49_00375 [Periweissella cryptocerci]
MKKISKVMVALIVALSVGSVFVTTASASTVPKTHKITSVPKAYRGTWYTYGYIYNEQTGASHKGYIKAKVSAKKFDYSKYTKKFSPMALTDAGAEWQFMPYKASGKGIKSNTIYLLNRQGIQAVRALKVNGQKVMLVNSEQGHSTTLTIYAKSKNVKLIKKSVESVNLFGMGIDSKNDAKKQRKDFIKMNKILKKYMGKSLHSAKLNHFGVTIRYYTAIDYVKYNSNYIPYL